VTGGDLEAVRRADWRFLLPDPELGRVACVAPVDGALVDALRLVAADVRTLPDTSEEAGERFDLVVARARPGVDELAGRLLAPNGRLYLELPASDVRAWRRRLEAEGWTGVEAHVHWPSRENATELVPFGDRAAAENVAARRAAGSRARALAWNAFLRMRALERGSRDAGLTAVRPAATAEAAPARPLADAGLETELGLRALGIADDASWVLLTPRFRASRHVVALLWPRGSGSPVAVAKIPRLPRDVTALAREAATLRALHGLGAHVDGTVPRVIAFDPRRTYPLLVETALDGRLLSPAVVRQDPDGAVARVSAWLRGLPAGHGDTYELRSRWERLLETPLRGFAASADAADRDLVTRTLELTSVLRDGPLRFVFEHGDLSHPNLFELPDGRLGVVDWELAEWRGLPLHDFAFFLGYVAFARARARSLPAHVEAFDAAFFGPKAWAACELAAAARRDGIDVRLVVPLVASAWARTAVRLIARADAAAPDLAARNRYFAIWRRVVERADELAAALESRERLAREAG
jgi:hypothetical protein